MSDVNKLDGKQCSFSPDQYKKKIDIEVDNIAPTGSFPWAMIQVYLGNNVRRGIWDTNTYIYGNKIGTSDQAINQVNKEGAFAWNPEQQDMLACDWGLKLNPICMLSFDLEVGTGKWSDIEQMWGYLADNELHPENPFGTLTILENKTDITKFPYFVWDSSAGSYIGIRVSSGIPPTLEDYQKMVDLFGKSLTVTVGGEHGGAYTLGSTKAESIAGEQQYEFFGKYSNIAAGNLGILLQQNVGNTLRFCFNWK